ncbi:mechanosensitive ion channel [Oscillatoria sp. CS-180]|uniref:mechanosensitive ion channel family protein n=1 Tax=Oscillatoria sp. CS-180 TaxID=3021720 RepID=UPI00232DE3F9|nr:mechanosensitive ion channel domain-containing protein [Oscillatoria sp. CS-180]MDB9526690.1 mechanosensitive ion channel [Oscillatoria sp. CS-180]
MSAQKQYFFVGIRAPRVRNQKLSRSGWAIALGIGLSLSIWTPVVAQEAAIESEAIAQPNAESAAPAESTGDVYFADIIVRGRPIFQIGGLTDLNASARAALINRRIASILSNTEQPGVIEVQPDASGDWATLRVNNRVIMTVTQQDADDFGSSVEELANRWVEELNEAFDKPPIAVDVAQRLNGTVRQLSRDAIDKLPAIIGALIVALVTWGIASGVRYAAFTWAKQTEGDRSTEVLVGRLGYGIVWVFGAIVALGILGLEFGALLGAFGLTSVAIGFSLKDVLSNYISGVVLLAARPFRLGDQVVIDSFEGTIKQIQLRATTLQTYDGRTVYIPNQEVFQASITNNTASPHRRSSIMVGVDYDADLTKAKQVIHEAVQNVKGVSSDSPIDVLVQELAASTVNLEVRFWVNSTRYAFLETTSEVAHAVKLALQHADVEMPTEIYTLQFRNSASLELNSSDPLPIAAQNDGQSSLST